MLPGTDKILHATVMIGDSPVMLNDEMLDFGVFGPGDKGSPVTIHISIEDVDAAYQRAIDAGAEVVMPLADMFWGDRYAILKDPFGHKWSMATHVEDVDPADMEKRCEQAFEGGPPPS